MKRSKWKSAGDDDESVTRMLEIEKCAQGNATKHVSTKQRQYFINKYKLSTEKNFQTITQSKQHTKCKGPQNEPSLCQRRRNGKRNSCNSKSNSIHNEPETFNWIWTNQVVNKHTHTHTITYERHNCSSNHSCNDDEITRSVYTLDTNMCSVSLRDATKAPKYTFVQIMKRRKIRYIYLRKMCYKYW